MKIRWAESQKGFTIIEVMTFLAVSGLMFIMAMVFINGKQNNVAFRQGMEATASMVTGTINSVANGEYPAIGNFQCTAPSGASYYQIGNQNTPQGTNFGCIFLGKALAFNTDGHGLQYKIYSVAGHQFSSSDNQPVQSFAEASPLVLDTLNTSGHSFTQTGNLELGLNYAKAFLCQGDCSGVGSGNSQSSIAAVGFFGSFGSYSSGGASSQNSGAQTVTVAALTQTSINADFSNLINLLPLTTGQYVLLCFNYGNQAGNVTIGGQSGQQTSVNLGFNERKPC